MKKLRRKVISIFLVTLMIFSSTITAFAASTDYTYKLSKREYTFGYVNGNPNKVAEHVPKFTAKNGKGKTLKEGKDYVLDRPNSWETKLPGIYKIYYQFIGNYSGLWLISYQIYIDGELLKDINNPDNAYTTGAIKAGFQIDEKTDKNLNLYERLDAGTYELKCVGTQYQETPNDKGEHLVTPVTNTLTTTLIVEK